MPPRDVTPTIRRRLLLMLLAPLTLLLALGVAVDYASDSTPVRTAYDQALANDSLGVAAHIHIDAAGAISADLPPQAVAVLRSDSYDNVYYVVLGPSGEFVAGDAGLPVAAAGAENPVFRNEQFREQAVRVASYRVATPAGAMTIAVAETTNKREHANRRILAGIVLTNALQFMVTLALVWFGVRYGLRPLLALKDQIVVRSARELAPLDVERVPDEVRPLTQALNRLFATVRESAHAQQQFLTNAAHQLRTPLAGLQAQLELMARDPAAGPLRDRLRAVYEGSRRLGRTANQLLALARAEPAANLASEFQDVELHTLVEEAVSRHLDRALSANLDLGAEAMPTRVAGVAWLLRELLANLLDNAITYTPAGGRVTLRCGADGAGAFLEVEDDGPGIAPSERERVVERFYRIPGATGEGCGLGLAIVDEIARSHHATLALEVGADGRGTRARVRFPTRR